jgi:hypothetical protein
LTKLETPDTTVETRLRTVQASWLRASVRVLTALLRASVTVLGRFCTRDDAAFTTPFKSSPTLVTKPETRPLTGPRGRLLTRPDKPPTTLPIVLVKVSTTGPTNPVTGKLFNILVTAPRSAVTALRTELTVERTDLTKLPRVEPRLPTVEPRLPTVEPTVEPTLLVRPERVFVTGANKPSNKPAVGVALMD